jgi:K+-sensing histidine kinase KdpD
MGNLNNPIFSALSDDLLTPVAVIQSNIELLKKHCNHTDSTFSKETFSFAENSIENIRNLLKIFISSILQTK